MKISIKREQSPLDLWSLVPEGSQEAGLSFAERLRVGEPCSGMRENRRSLAGGESNFRPQVKNKIITSARPAFDLIFNKKMAASSR